jgi:hypothetical protein
MLISRRIPVAFATVLLSSLLLVSSALAAQPSTVTVRVVGLTGTTLLPQTSVSTTTVPIEPEPSKPCSGTSAGGALYDATHGNWVVKYDSGIGYEIDGIQGLNFPPFSVSSPPDAYWSFWLNGAPASSGACEQELEPGSDVVFFAQCTAIGTDCPTSKTAPQHFLTESVPATNVQVGAPVSVTVGSLSTETGASESLPGEVTVSEGSVSAAPNAQGVATLTFPSVGTYTIEAAAPDSVPSDPHTVCVHNGNDGTCGTTIPGVPKGVPNGGPEIVHPTPAEVATIGGVKNGRHYSRRKGPRILSGLVQVPTGGTLHEVRISLQRRDGKRCTEFNGAREAFVHARCGVAHFFSVGSTDSFSYLLPAALPVGRYVFDIEAIDNAGRTTKLVAGVSHVIFYVK